MNKTAITGLQTGYSQRLLLLVLLHSLPVFWANTEASGTAPAAALLALSFARLFTFQIAGSGNALLMLATALIYCFIGCWVTKLLVSKLEPVRQPLHTIILAVLTLVPLASVYWPIYLTIGQDQTQHVNLIGLVAHTLDWRILLGYWIGLHLAIIGLFVGNVVNFDHPLLELAQRWRKPAMTVTLSALCTVIVLGNYPEAAAREALVRRLKVETDASVRAEIEAAIKGEP